MGLPKAKQQNTFYYFYQKFYISTRVFINDIFLSFFMNEVFSFFMNDNFDFFFMNEQNELVTSVCSVRFDWVMRCDVCSVWAGQVILLLGSDEVWNVLGTE